jgi:dTDP-4-dehydrorhamnose 3,5-epimerase
MKFFETDIKGLIVCEPVVFHDDRGFFFESYNQSLFCKNGITTVFVQDNQSYSTSGVIRGLHFQAPPFAQAKLVRVLEGRILDVAVDIRKNSPTYGRSFSIELSAENRTQLFIPHGFAHGFSVLSNVATVMYKCDQFYNKESEKGIRFDDPELNIDWKINVANAIVSEKDLILPLFKNCDTNFEY